MSRRGGSEDRLRSPAGPRQSPSRGHRGAKPPGSSGGLRSHVKAVHKRKSIKKNVCIRQNIDNSECFGVKYVKIYPEMTSQ